MEVITECAHEEKNEFSLQENHKEIVEETNEMIANVADAMTNEMPKTEFAIQMNTFMTEESHSTFDYRMPLTNSRTPLLQPRRNSLVKIILLRKSIEYCSYKDPAFCKEMYDKEIKKRGK